MHPQVDRLGLRPVSTMPSKPANLSSAGQKPPAWLSPIRPEVGLLAVAVHRLCPLIGTPVVGESMNDSVFSGPNGSAPGGVFFSR